MKKNIKITVEACEPLEKEFTELDAIVEVEIPKCSFPVVTLWGETENGYSNLVAAPVNIIVRPKPFKTNLLVYDNDNQISGVLILN